MPDPETWQGAHLLPTMVADKKLQTEARLRTNEMPLHAFATTRITDITCPHTNTTRVAAGKLPVA